MGLSYKVYKLPVLKALMDLGGSAKPQQVYPSVEKIMGDLLKKNMGEYDYYKSGDIIWKNKIRGVRGYLKLEKLIDCSQKGVWLITEKGKDYLFEHTQLSPAQ